MTHLDFRTGEGSPWIRDGVTVAFNESGDFIGYYKQQGDAWLVSSDRNGYFDGWCDTEEQARADMRNRANERWST